MTDDGTKTFESPDHLMRAAYRTKITGDDKLSQAFLTREVNGVAMVPAEDLARWCLGRFVTSLEVRDSETAEWRKILPTAEAFMDLAPEAGANLMHLAMMVCGDTVVANHERLAALKKALPVPSASSSSGAGPSPDPGSPSSA